MKTLLRHLSIPGITCRLPDLSGPYTTIGIGGEVGMSIQVETLDALIKVLRILREKKIQHVVMGGGSNIVFPEKAPDLVLVLNRTSGIQRIAPRRISVRSGETNLAIMAWCGQNGVAGLEFLAGIPGTLGGATAVNAGAFGRDMAACFVEARILDLHGQEQSVGPEACAFKYRDSVFKRGDAILLEIVLAVEPEDPVLVRRRIRRNFLYRKEHHPHRAAKTAGCFFKNPQRSESGSAGRLIDAAGLRGMRRAGLEISPRHANFIVHHGGAGLTELQDFMGRITNTVEAQRGIRLEREVLFVAPDGRRY